MPFFAATAAYIPRTSICSKIMAPVILPKHPLVPGRPDSVQVSVLGFGTSPLGHAYGVRLRFLLFLEQLTGVGTLHTIVEELSCHACMYVLCLLDLTCLYET